MKKVYHIEVFGRGNTQEYVGKVTSGITEYEIEIISSQLNDHRSLTLDYFKNYGVVNSSVKKMLNYISGNIKLIFLAFRGGEKIFHFHWLKFSPLDFVLFLFIGISKTRTVITVHESLPHAQKRFDRLFFGMIYKLVDGLIFHSSVSKNQFYNEFSTENKKSIIIPHYGYKINCKQDTHKSDSPNILFFGSIKPYKGLDILLESLAGLNKKYSWHLKIVGKSYVDLDDYRRRYSSLPIDWEIGWVSNEDLNKEICYSDIIIFPYKSIDTSGAIHLALSAGKLVMASDLPFFREIIVDNEDGLIFEASVEGLQEALTKVIPKYNNYNQLGLNAKNKMLTEHSLGEIGKKTARFYDKVFG